MDAREHIRQGGARVRRRAAVTLGLLTGLQAIVVIVSVAVRLSTLGWFFVIFLFGGFLLVLAPIVAGSVLGMYALWMGGPRLRQWAAAAFVAMDLSLLAFALTLPDITDDESDTAAPILVLASGAHEFSDRAVDICARVAGSSALCHLAAVALAIGLGITALCRPRHP